MTDILSLDADVAFARSQQAGYLLLEWDKDGLPIPNDFSLTRAEIQKWASTILFLNEDDRVPAIPNTMWCLSRIDYGIVGITLHNTMTDDIPVLGYGALLHEHDVMEGIPDSGDVTEFLKEYYELASGAGHLDRYRDPNEPITVVAFERHDDATHYCALRTMQQSRADTLCALAASACNVLNPEDARYAQSSTEHR